MKRDFDFCVPDNQIVIVFKIVNQCSFDTLRITMIYEFAKLVNLSITSFNFPMDIIEDII
jgi:hypothetical protein